MDPVVLVQQDDVAMATHDLDHQFFLQGITQFILGGKADDENALVTRCLNGQNTRAEQVLPQQHAEHRRLGRVFPRFRGQVDPRGGWIG